MPGRLKVRILSARDLPVMDRASELTDAFVEVKNDSLDTYPVNKYLKLDKYILSYFANMYNFCQICPLRIELLIKSFPMCTVTLLGQRDCVTLLSFDLYQSGCLTLLSFDLYQY